MTLEEVRVWTPWILGSMTFLGTVVLGFIGYLLKRAYESIVDGFKELGRKLERYKSELEDQIDQVERDLMTFKADLPKNFVLRDDWIRTVAILENKIDRQSSDIKDISEKLSGQIETVSVKLNDQEVTLQKICSKVEGAC